MNEFDLVLVGGGNLVSDRSVIFNGSYPVWSISSSLAFGGLSASGALSDSTKAIISAAASNAEFFWVRDTASEAAIGQDSISVRPDLTFLWPHEPDNTVLEYEVGCCLAPCPWWESFEVSAWMDVICRWRHVCIPFYQRRGLDFNLVAPHTDNVCSAFSEQHFRSSRLIVGARLHSIIFSIQMVKPFVAVNYDDKVKHFLEDNGLSDLTLEVDQPDRLSETIDYVYDNEVEILNRIQKVRLRLVAEAREAAAELSTVAQRSRRRKRILSRFFT